MFKWLYYSPSANGAFCLFVFYLVIDFLAELVRFQILKFKILNLYYTGIMQYLLFKNMQVMWLHASTFPILQALLCLISGAAQPINFRCQTSK